MSFWVHVCMFFPNIYISLHSHRKWCIKCPAAAVTIVWVDWQRTVILPATLIYVALNPTNSTLHQQLLVCSFPLQAWPLCHRACIKPWHVKCKKPRMTTSLRLWKTGAATGLMALRRRKAWWSPGGEGGHQGPQSQLVTVQVLDAHLEQQGLLGSKPAQEGPSVPPKQQDIRWARAGPLAASRVLPGSRSLT